MKRSRALIWGFCLVLLSACSGGDPEGDASGAKTLSLGSEVSGAIAEVGEVDWYRYRAVEANNVLQVRCSSNTFRPDVDLLVTAYEVDGEGNRVRIYGDHAPEGSQLPADLALNLYIDTPKDLLIAVRDLLDDEASEHPYYLSLDYLQGGDGDENFASASFLAVDDPGSGYDGNIGHVGDVDCYTFVAGADGVYAVTVDYTPFAGGTDVDLKIEIYDGDGALVMSDYGQKSKYRLLPCLAAGDYYVLIEDFGRDDYDTSSNYHIAVQTAAAAEAGADDNRGEATVLSFDAALQSYLGSGALEYAGDQDWYHLPLAGIPASGLQVLEISFDDGGAGSAFRYQIQLEDVFGEVLLVHDYLGGSATYRTEILAGGGDHFLSVQSAEGQAVEAAAPYELSVQVLDVDDPAEAGAGNDSINTAQALAPASTPENGWTEAKIAYRGDDDWYYLDTDNGNPRVLEMFMETEEPSLADYAVSILRDDLIEKVYDSNGEDGPTELKTSILLPAGSPVGPVTYFFKVSDAQGDEGDGLVPYYIRGNLVDIPSALPADPGAPAGAVYYDEASEGSNPGDAHVRLEHNSLLQKEYAVNTALLDFNGPNPSPGITRSAAGGLTTIAFPWIGGYIDYQGDQDWFELDLGPLYQQGVPADSDWYYDLQVELYVGGAVSPVEYVWKVYRDHNDNRILVDRAGDSDGFFASAGDSDTAVAPLNLFTPAAGSGDQFWVGDAWEGKFYLSLGDFNFVDAGRPDDDWGYEVPYYCRLTLVYHPGVSHP